ncbi:alpha/beta hydrolase family protein [Piscinibacter terrae]|nr:alpha/beta fold hydrolase [Albitalea terrae]
MTTFWRHRAWMAAAAVLMLALGAGAARAEPIPAEVFARKPAIDSVVPSPSGKRLAIIMFGPEGYRRLAVMDLDPIGAARVVASYDNANVNLVRWVSDDRLVYDASQEGVQIREGGAGTFAVNHDGSAPRQLIAWQRSTGSAGSGIQSHVLPFGWFLHSATDDGSGDVFVFKLVKDHVGDIKEFQLARLSTTTGRLQSLALGMPEGARRWMLDAAREPRVIVSHKDGRAKVFWRDGQEKGWRELADFDPLNSGFEPELVTKDGKLLVAAIAKDDRTGLFTLDPATGKIDPDPVLAINGFDLNPGLKLDSQTQNLVGMYFTADRPMSYWFDSGLQRIQRALDATLPQRSNHILCGRCESARFLVVHSASDRQPGEFLLFDREKNSLQPIGASRPWIKEETQGRRTFHRFKARDGLEVPVYVTHPSDATAKQPLPAVLLVHGGPFLRGTSLGWHEQAQFLASRGYRVIEPEFRGSTGYGRQLFRAGWKQWGQAMQNDLADAVQWAAAEGLVDASKVCIMGASYGGYAALMGPIVHPGVYQCAISLAGVTDIQLLYELIESDASESAKKYSMPVLIGDPVKDSALLPTISPLQRAAEIKVPVLLAHGWLDRRVPYAHAKEFFDAARKAGVAIEKVDYKEEGHGLMLAEDRADYYRRVEKFLEQSLRGPAK